MSGNAIELEDGTILRMEYTHANPGDIWERVLLDEDGEQWGGVVGSCEALTAWLMENHGIRRIVNW